MIDAAIAADMSLQIKSIESQGLNLGPLRQKAQTLPLSYSRMPYLCGLFSCLKHTACKAVLNKPLVRAALKHSIIQLLLDAAF